MLNDDIRACAERATLCWLATVDAAGQPNVSPKEIFAVFDEVHLVIANIASPASARNVGSGVPVCVSFVDIFVQKGWKVRGQARHVDRRSADHAHWAAPLVAMAGPRFPLRGVIVVRATAVEPIVAPSYRLHPAETTEATQVASALRTYRVEPAADFWRGRSRAA